MNQTSNLGNKENLHTITHNLNSALAEDNIELKFFNNPDKFEWNEAKEFEILKDMVNSQTNPIVSYEISLLLNLCEKWKKEFPLIQPYYAVKCLPQMPIIRAMNEFGFGYDCATIREIKQALDIGVTPERIIYAHPIKPIHSIKFCKEHGIKMTTLDCESEIEKIAKFYPEMEIVIRLKKERKDNTSIIDLDSKFGASISHGKSLFDKAISAGLNVIGISFHVGWYTKNADVYVQMLGSAKEMFDYANTKGVPMKLLDIGGGFLGVEPEDYSFIKTAAVINQAIDDKFGQMIKEKKVKVIAEPGTYFNEDCQNTYYKVIKIIEQSDSEQTIMLNDGAFGSLNVLFDDFFITPPVLCSRKVSQEEPDLLTQIMGNSFSKGSQDYCSVDLKLPKLQTGDVLLLKDTGGYNLSFSRVYLDEDKTNKVFYSVTNSQ